MPVLTYPKVPKEFTEDIMDDARFELNITPEPAPVTTCSPFTKILLAFIEKVLTYLGFM